MHFSASSQSSKIFFEYQGIIFNGKKVLKFSQIEAVRLTVFHSFFFMTSLILLPLIYGLMRNTFILIMQMSPGLRAASSIDVFLYY